MEKKPPPWTLGELAAMLGGVLHGPADTLIERPAPATGDDASGIGFAENQAYLEQAEQSGIGALLLSPGFESAKPYITLEAPRVAFGALLTLSHRPLPLCTGIHPLAVVHPSAHVDPSASIGPYVVVEQNASVGPETRIFPFCYIGEGCKVGRGCTLNPHVVLYQDVYIGDGSTLHSGVVVGADGFGYNWDGCKQVKVPQVGGVEIGRDVEIGALSAIDRATAGNTTIGDDTKIDNLVQVAHNVRIGSHTVIAGLTGISGSVTIGNRVTVAGNVGFSDHVSVCDHVTLAGRTGVTKTIDQPGVYWGTPALPILEVTKYKTIVAKLPELRSRIRKLEREIENMRKEDT